jgi:methionyl aminopeptidase
VFGRRGARSAPTLVYGFPGHALISVNDETVHGLPGSRRLKRGDFVKLDVTVEKDGYVADSARSVIVGNGTDVARRLVACARGAFRAALPVARAGVPVNEIDRAVQQEVRRHGLLSSMDSANTGRTDHSRRAVRTEPVRSVAARPVDRGLVLTIEPMVSAGSARVVEDGNGWTIRRRDGSLAAHHEHTLVITKEHRVILSAT